MKTSLLTMLLASGVIAADTIGVRPYEMDWANRTKDDRDPIIDFEDNTPWTVEAANSKATFVRTREQQLFGKYVYKLTYRRIGDKTPSITLRPPKPVPVPVPFDIVGCWIYGNNWAWVTDPSTPRVQVNLLFKTADNKEHEYNLTTVRWKEWFLALKRYPDQDLKILSQPETHFTGFKITNGTNAEDRAIFFDSLTIYEENQQPLTFKPRPKRGIDMFPGQSPGANNGPGRLPFPNREDTILPDSKAPGATNTATQNNSTFTLQYTGSDGTLTISYKPETGRWDDVTATWNQHTFKPLLNGGPTLFTAKENRFGTKPEKATHVKTELVNQTIESTWNLELNGKSTQAKYIFTLKGKTLIVDTIAKGGTIAAVAIGKANGLVNPKVQKVPYYDYAGGGRPAVIASGTPQDPLFYSAHIDWYRSNASSVWSEPFAVGTEAAANWGTIYIPKTDGQLNDCFDRFFVTIGPKFEEHLPNIPNPKSPYKHVAGKRVWKVHFAGDLEKDKQYWKRIWRHGLRNIIINGHEVGWRDGGESFTFRTKAAPKKGGDKGMYDYTRYMQDKLGFVYGPYNNFTDFAPVNEYWRTDIVSRNPESDFMHAWARCYAPKPQYAVEYCAELAPIIQKKFNFGTAYCDVHTSVTPWSRTDFDARVPGAGTFAATFYAFGEIMLHQKNAWKGPVYSEGPHHCYYSGLTDGNYAQDRSYYLPTDPWLVDFDLRKMHPLECNFGMGDDGMFYKNRIGYGDTPEQNNHYIDRFIAATAAYGHPSYLVTRNMRSIMRSYFMLQQLQSYYTQVDVKTIQYANENGELLDTTQAIMTGALKLSHLVITYEDGTTVIANGSTDIDFNITHDGYTLQLPPAGYAGWSGDKKVFVKSAINNNNHADYVDSPEYIFVDGRDYLFQRFPKAASAGLAVCRFAPDRKTAEFIPLEGTECAFAVNATKAIALAEDLTELGPAQIRQARGLTYILPVKNAFSYKLLIDNSPIPVKLTSEAEFVSPNETVTVKGQQTHTATIPADAKNGQRIWMQFEGQWIDFTVRNLAEVKTEFDENKLVFTLASNKNYPIDLTLEFQGNTKSLQLQPKQPSKVEFNFLPDNKPSTQELTLKINMGKILQNHTFKFTTLERPVVVKPPLTEDFQVATQLDGQAKPQGGLQGSANAMLVSDFSAGGVKKSALFMHPPWRGGTGKTFTLHEVNLPDNLDCVFKSSVGKRDSTDIGDGIFLEVRVIDKDKKEHVVAKKHIIKHEWSDFQADLTPWKGQQITLKLVSDCGPNRNTIGDHAGWAETRIESKQNVLQGKIDN